MTTTEDKIYECECGCIDFYLYQDGRVKCADCDSFFTDITVTFPKGIPEVNDG